MNELDFIAFKTQIDDFYNERVFMTQIMREESFEEEVEKLNKIFNYGFEENNGRILNFKIKHVSDLLVYEYSKISYKTSKKTSYIAIVKNNKPLFLMSSSIFNSDSVRYNEEMFTTYDDNCHIDNRIKIRNSVINNNVVIKDIMTLNKESLIDFDYIKRDYSFYYDNKGLILLKTENELYESSSPRVTTALNRIDKIKQNILNGFDATIQKDVVKEYSIKRKEKEK